MQFGNTLKALRVDRDVSIRALAKQMNVSRAFIQQAERSELIPSEARIRQIAEILETDADELLLLAGKIPADIVQILQAQPSLVASIRASQSPSLVPGVPTSLSAESASV